MSLTLAAGSAGGTAFSSTALLMVVGALVIAFAAHKPIRAWIRNLHTRTHEHFYGPQHLYEPATDPAKQADADAVAEDGFDWDIYADGT